MGRRFKNPTDGRDGFWIRVKGMYTFPEFMTKGREYVILHVLKLDRELFVRPS